MRLDQLVARNLGCSRAAARQILARNGIDPSAAAPPLPGTLTLDGRHVVLRDAFHLLLNKPAGYVTARSDTTHAVAAELLRAAPLFGDLRPVGRLDRETTGLLIWTTDGQWLQHLSHPKRAVPRTYQAALARPFRPAGSDLVLADGYRPLLLALEVIDDHRELHPSLLRPPDAEIYATITVGGGAYHEVRRILAALGSHVLALCRVGFGRLTLPGHLAPGAYCEIRMDEV